MKAYREREDSRRHKRKDLKTKRRRTQSRVSNDEKSKVLHFLFSFGLLSLALVHYSKFGIVPGLDIHFLDIYNRIRSK